MRGLWLIIVAGCGDFRPAVVPDAPPPDGSEGPLTYEVRVYWSDPADVPHLEPKPAIYIDGAQTESTTFQFANARAAIGHLVRVEMRYGDVIMRSQSYALGGCLHDLPRAVIATDAWCAHASGDLRFLNREVNGSDGFCAGEGGCWPRCGPFEGFPPCHSASAGPRCTSIYESVEPIATRLGCAPAGTEAVGEPCSLVTSAAGMHDDCEEGLLCVGGTCRRTCSPRSDPPEGCTKCSYVLGHAPELGICD